MLVDNGERLIIKDAYRDYWESRTVTEHRHRYLIARECAEQCVVLDAACGTGYGSKLLAEKAAEVYGIDISADAIAHATKHFGAPNIQFQQMSIEKLEYPDNFFDLIVSFETIEHVERDVQKSFLAEIKRCLKKDGILIMSTPNDDLYRKMTRGEYVNEFHVAEFTEESYKEFLATQFKNVVFYYQNITDVSTLLREGENTNIYKGVCDDLKNQFGRYYMAVCSDCDVTDRLPANHVLIPKISEYYHNRYLDREAFLCADLGEGWDGRYSVNAWSRVDDYQGFSFTFAIHSLNEHHWKALRFDPCEESCRVRIISAETNTGAACTLTPMNASLKDDTWDVFHNPDPMYLLSFDGIQNFETITITGEMAALSARTSWEFSTEEIKGLNERVHTESCLNEGLRKKISEQQTCIDDAVNQKDKYMRICAEKDQEIVGLQKHLEHHVAEENSVRGEKDKYMRICAEKDQEIVALQRRLEYHVAEENSVRSEKNRYMRICADKDQEIVALQAERENCDRRAREWEAAYSSIVNARSWKITEPCRKMGRVVRKLMQKSNLFGKAIRLLARMLGKRAKPEMVRHPDPVICENASSAEKYAEIAAARKKILLISYYCPTRAHAGGLRILDLYKQIKEKHPEFELTLFTYKREQIDWKYDDITEIFDRAYYSDKEELSYADYVRVSGNNEHYHVIDCQFLQAAYDADSFKNHCNLLLFTPMELLAKSFYDELCSKKALDVSRWLSSVKMVASEVSCSEKADRVVCVSKSDEAFLRDKVGVASACSLETGLSKLEFPACDDAQLIPAGKKKNVLLYVAYFGSETNVQALKWYLEQVHPIVKARVPDYCFEVVGRGDLTAFQKYQDGQIRFVGEVESLTGYIMNAKVGIAPALFGAGFRGKINQYAFYSVPCVVTKLAAEGLKYVNGVDICIAESAQDFAAECIKLLEDSAFNAKLGKAAHGTCMENYTWDSKDAEISNIYNLF